MPTTLLKKGQMQIGESAIAIIMVLIVLAIVAVVAFTNIQNKYKTVLTEDQDLGAIEIAQFVTGLYELRCAKSGMKTACIDKYKAEAFEEIGPALNYYEQLGFANITLDQIYPEAADYPITIYNNQIPPEAGGQETRLLIIPIAIHDPVTDTLAFGTLSIKKYNPII